MGRIKALLTGVCRYPGNEHPFLPYFARDVLAVRDAAVQGLGAQREDLLICGREGRATAGDLRESLHRMEETVSAGDVFLFYFSGLWVRNDLLLSDRRFHLEQLVQQLNRIGTRKKVLVFDCSHLGNFSENRITRGELHRNVDYLADQGYVVLTSAGEAVSSGIDRKRGISIYTAFLADTLRNRYLIRNREKNIFDLQKALYFAARQWNQVYPAESVQTVLRTYQPETLSMQVTPGAESELTKVYAEAESYLIYDVQEIAHTESRRLAVRVILRYCFLLEDLAGIAEEIMEKLYAEHPDVIWIYFGRSEEDMKNGRYLCQTTWAEQSQNTNWWYRKTEQSVWIRDIYFTVNPSYPQYGGFPAREREEKTDEEVRKEREDLMDRFLQAAQNYLVRTEETDAPERDVRDRPKRTAASYRGEAERIYQRICMLPGADSRKRESERMTEEEQLRAFADTVLDLILLEKGEQDNGLFSEETHAEMKRMARERVKEKMEEYMS